MKVIRSAPRTGRIFPAGDTRGTRFLSSFSAAGRIKSIKKNPSVAIGNRTHNLAACSSVPKPTAPQRLAQSRSASKERRKKYSSIGIPTCLLAPLYENFVSVRALIHGVLVASHYPDLLANILLLYCLYDM